MKPFTFTVEQHEHGILIRSEPMPIDTMTAIIHMGAHLGYDQMHLGVSGATGAFMALTTTESGALWAEEIRESATKNTTNPLSAWMRGPDRGISAVTIAHVLAGVPLLSFGASTPQDGGDFGRCLRLVRLMDWVDRLPEVAERYPEWRHIVKRWSGLEAMHDDEDWPGVYALLQDQS